MARVGASRSRKRPARIREIAKALGVSIGMVDRALHDRRGIKPKTRTSVLELAKELGYRPNLAARFFSSRKHLPIGVNLPREIVSFWDLLRYEVQGLVIAPRRAKDLGSPTVIRLSPHILMKSNLKLFLERMRPDEGKGQGPGGWPAGARAGRGGSMASYADEIT